MDKEGEPKTKLPTGLVRIEKSISPERVWGKDFRIPSIVGEGSGLGFKIENLHLPKDWETKISELNTINYEHFYNVFFKPECEEFDLKPGVIKYDSEGILREITINTSPVSKLYLEKDGKYKFENVNNLKAAIILTKSACKLFGIFEKNGLSYPHITGREGAYGPKNLVIPEKFLKAKRPVIPKSYYGFFQKEFKVKASNIFGRFGMTLKKIHFDEKFLLTSIYIEEGNACGFLLEGDGSYGGYNIDNCYQAAALFGATAVSVNHLLIIKEMKNI